MEIPLRDQFASLANFDRKHRHPERFAESVAHATVPQRSCTRKVCGYLNKFPVDVDATAMTPLVENGV